MALRNIKLTKDDFDQLDWKTLLAQASEKTCHHYCGLMSDKVKEAEENSDEKLAEVYGLLGVITSFRLKPDHAEGPLLPWIVTSDWRSYGPEDLSDDHLAVLAEIAPSIQDGEMRARVADVLWVRTSNYQFAQLATKAYLEAADGLKGETRWVEGLDRMERALEISARLGKQHSLYQEVIDYIVAFLDNLLPDSAPYYATSRAMELLQQQRQGDALNYAALAETTAQRAESESNWLSAARLWRVKARWHALAGDTDAERATQIAAAEVHLQHTDQVLAENPPNYSVAQFNLQQAIEAFRRIGGMQERVAELHKRLLEYQEKSLEHFGRFSVDIDLRKSIEQTRSAIEGKTLYDVLFTLARLAASPSVEALRQRVETFIKDAPLQFIFPSHILSEKGKLAAQRPSVLSDDPDQREQAIRAEMFRQALYDQEVLGVGMVLPALEQIRLEHNVRVADLFPLVSNNPFVPSGREELYAQALHAGMQGYFVVSTHLLLPQIEHSIRDLLYRSGAITSKLTSNGIQDEYDLNRMLYMPEVKEIFGEDVTFDLQGLLVERFGSNLRNLTAHGLLPYEAFFTARIAYLWWLTLRLCCLPVLTQLQSSEQLASE